MSYDTVASEQSISKVKDSLTKKGVSVSIVESKKQALEVLIMLIPAGSSIMTGASETLVGIGFVEHLKTGVHPWNNLKDAIIAEKDPKKQNELRRQSSLADYFIGSVHALTEGGEIITGSNSGSQLASYAYTSNAVIWVIGAQKIVNDVATGLDRLLSYTVPLEDKRMKSVGFPGTVLNKTLVWYGDPYRKVHVILIKQSIGF